MFKLENIFFFFKGLSPIKTIQEALHRANWSIDSVDLFELNETYAAQSVAVIRELGIDPDKVLLLHIETMFFIYFFTFL